MGLRSADASDPTTVSICSIGGSLRIGAHIVPLGKTVIAVKKPLRTGAAKIRGGATSFGQNLKSTITALGVVVLGAT